MPCIPKSIVFTLALSLFEACFANGPTRSGLYADLGRTFAADDGPHGGFSLGGGLDIRERRMVYGVNVRLVQEFGPLKLFGPNPQNVYEHFWHAGASAGWKLGGEGAFIVPSLGAGYVGGTYRGALLRTDEECKGWSFFGCGEDETVQVKTYEKRRLEGLTLDPGLRLELDPGKGFVFGVDFSGWIHPDQGLATVSAFLLREF
jgi:hypothetical protein